MEEIIIHVFDIKSDGSKQIFYSNQISYPKDISFPFDKVKDTFRSLYHGKSIEFIVSL